MLGELKSIAIKAGAEVLKVYSQSVPFSIKEDRSPVTEADLLSDKIIRESLSILTPDVPIISEESELLDFSVREKWSKFWLVDPLDGTKDFLAKNDQYTINIALIENKKPVIGVIYAPSLDLMYYAQYGEGSYKNNEEKLLNTSRRTNLIAADSVFHSTKEMQQFFVDHSILDIKKIGSSLKFGFLAEGIIDVYPRFNGTKEWDTAAGQIIAEEAGCKVIDLNTKRTMEYNKVSIKNNFFIASRSDLNFV